MYRADSYFKIVNSTSAVKYIYKYILKGNDRIIVEPKSCSENGEPKSKCRDEVQKFIDGRYISPTMAIWNIYGYEITENYPSVTKLQIHEENKQTVLFDNIDNIEERMAASRNTTLTQFFKLNQEDPDARNHTYVDILRHYTWNSKDKCFKERVNNTTRNVEGNEGIKSEMIGRIPMVIL